MAGPAVMFKAKAKVSDIRKGRLRNIEPPRLHRNLRNQSECTVFQPLWQTMRKGVCWKTNLHLLDGWALPTIEFNPKSYDPFSSPRSPHIRRRITPAGAFRSRARQHQ